MVRVATVSDVPAVRRIKAASAVVAVEAVALVGFGGAELAGVDRDHPSVAVTSAVFFFLYAVGLALAARGLFRLRSWGRGPVVLAQLIQLGVAWSFRGNETNWVALLLAVPAVGVLVVLLSPSTAGTLYRSPVSEDEDPGSS